MSYDNGKPPKSPYTAEELSELTDGNRGDIDLHQLKDEKKPTFRERLANEAAQMAVERGRRFAAKTVLTGGIPWIGGVLAVHEGYLFGKDIYLFIKAEKELAKLAGDNPPKKAFYELVERTRSPLVRENAWILDQKYQAGIKGKSNLHFEDISEYWKIKSLEEPVVPEVLSKAAEDSYFQGEADQLFEEAALVKGYIQMNFPAQSAAHKYQYMLATAVEGLGRSHFDQVNYPERGMRFDRFYAERAYMDGHEAKEIGSTILEKSPFALGLDYVNTTKRNEYIEKLTNFSHPGLDEARNAVSQWKQRMELPKYQKISPQEYFEHKSRTEAAAEAREKSEYRKFAELEQEYHQIQLSNAKQLLDEYRKADDLKTTTTQEYMLELARMNQKGEILFNKDNQIVVKLISAGHNRIDIVNALQEASPFGHQRVYGESIYYETIERIENNPKLKELVIAIGEMKEKYKVMDEIRLDRLGLAYEQSGRGEYLGQGFKQTSDPRNIEKFDRSFDQLNSVRDYEFGR